MIGVVPDGARDEQKEIGFMFDVRRPGDPGLWTYSVSPGGKARSGLWAGIAGSLSVERRPDRRTVKSQKSLPAARRSRPIDGSRVPGGEGTRLAVGRDPGPPGD